MATQGWFRARKKPVVIDARRAKAGEIIETREGFLKPQPGDYIIRGVFGELYLIDRDIFEQTYELVDE